MGIEIVPANLEYLSVCSTIPMSLEIKSRYAVERLRGESGFRLKEENVHPPQFFDYDVIDGEGPTRWLKRFDTSAWRIFLIRQNGKAIGAATVAVTTPHVFMLDGREDMTVLWDIRVRPEFRHTGIGTKLFSEAAKFSKSIGFRQLKVETQNINVPACKFYTKQRCHLGGINFYQYTQNPLTTDQIQLLWYLDL
jgi:ribosomal protein S18 acetylase RimI-like enzyme